jgi:predicted GNAT family acetyltransferase
MNSDLDKAVVENNESAYRFEAMVDGEVALVAYRRTGDRIIFTHTEVPEALEGRGLGSKLAHAALEFARAEKLTVIPLCPFVAGYIRRHREYEELVSAEYRT